MKRRPALLLAALAACAIWQFASSPRLFSQDNSERGLELKLRGAETEPTKPEEIAAPKAAKLDKAETDEVIARLPKEGPKGEKKGFALRKSSTPPPRTGKKIEGQFPPRTTQKKPDVDKVSAPLSIVRFAPDGAVALASHLSVTFSHDMVALDTVDKLSAGDVPVEISPRPEGSWRWVGTRTLLFEPAPFETVPSKNLDGKTPKNRFPMATRYRVKIPAGTKSIRGNTLGQESSWTFSTPAAKLKHQFPGNKTVSARHPVIVLVFDQRVDPKAVLPHVELRSAKPNTSKTFALRLATAEDIGEDERAANYIKNRGEANDRIVAVRTKKPLPLDSPFQLVITRGAPSFEGPVTTSKERSFDFRTYGPLKVAATQCGWENGKHTCPPGAPIQVRFSNPIDAEKFDSGMIVLDPKTAEIRPSVQGHMIYAYASTKGRTKYRVTLSPDITDTFGQKLGEEYSFEIETTEAPIRLSAPGRHLAVLDPGGAATFSFFSTYLEKVELEVRKVAPQDWPTYLKFLRDKNRRNTTPRAPGARAHGSTIKIAHKPDELVETVVDLRDIVKKHGNQLVVILDAKAGKNPIWASAWVQRTKIGLDAFVGEDKAIVWANSLEDGKPLQNVQVEIGELGQSGSTNAEGLFGFELGESRPKAPALVVVRHGDDLAFLPESDSWWSRSGNWYKSRNYTSLQWCTFDDRKMYRPGEKVHVKGWVRHATRGPKGDVTSSAGIVTGVRFQVKDRRNVEIAKGYADVTKLGGFDLSFETPDTINLGRCHVSLTAETTVQVRRDRYSHSLEVQEFRRPEFAVNATMNAGPHLVGESATAKVNASYYSGGSLPGAPVKWTVRTTTGTFRPEGWDKFTFGTWRPWWRYSRGLGGWHGGAGSEPERFVGSTDGAGDHTIHIDFKKVTPPEPTTVTATATVTDLNAQAWTASTTTLVHPSRLYVGLRSDTTFVEKGKPLDLDLIVTDIDGKAIPEMIVDLRCYRVRWVQEKGVWAEKEEEAGAHKLTSLADPISASFENLDGGEYRVRARVVDGRDRPNQSQLTLWVAGEKRAKRRNVQQEEVTLIPNRKEYQDGDVAEILVQAPFAKSEGVVTLRRGGLLETKRIQISDSSYTLKIPIRDAYVPGLTVQVDLVGATIRANDDGEVNDRLPKRPAYASGNLKLDVPPTKRTLEVKARPREKELEPGSETHVDVLVKDANGRPVKDAEVAVVVVDEAVLALTGYDVVDPIAIFYRDRHYRVRDYHSRRYVRLREFKEKIVRIPGAVQESGPVLRAAVASDDFAAAGAEAKGVARGRNAMMRKNVLSLDAESESGHSAGQNASPIAVRVNFDALAHFSAAVPTDVEGYARVKVELPDSLTRYRVFAVVASGENHFGKDESSITARMSLQVRPSAPRFLNFGDRFELPVILQNQTDKPMDVAVALRASNARIDEGAGRRVTVPANDRVEVRFPCSAELAGTARFEVAAVSGKYSDAADVKIPVWTPATTEAFATYGSISSSGAAGAGQLTAIVQPIAKPEGVVASFGGLEITTSSTQLQALTDAVIYITEYPYGCAEQIASRVLTIAALRDVLSAFEADGLPSPAELVAAVGRDIDKLRGLQNRDGGFSFWQRGRRSWPYLGVHVAHALVRAVQKDFHVPKEMLQRSQSYLTNIDRFIPKEYSAQARQSIQAYALFVLGQMPTDKKIRQNAVDKARKILGDVGPKKLPLEATGWLLATVAKDPESQDRRKAALRHLSNRVAETAATAQFNTSYSDGAHLLLHSSRRTDGVLLDALLKADPKNDVIPKLVRGLLGHRVQGRWRNTQENAFVLLALDGYFREYEKEKPYFVAKAWLGDRFAGEHGFEGRTTDQHHISIPMEHLTSAKGGQDLTLSKEGRGRLYYRLGLKYAPTSLKLEAADHGFAVTRTYEAVDDADDVTRDKSGVWQIRRGARVRVRLSLVAPARRYHVALVDPLPAGLEAINPELAVSGDLPLDTGAPTARGRGGPRARRSYFAPWWYQWRWYEHQNLRDERVEAFTSRLHAGVYNYSYVTRATIPGNFVVPPTRAEEMYHPETFGRAATERVVIK